MNEKILPGSVKIGDHIYPDRYAPGKGGPIMDAVWDALDTIKPDLIPPSVRAYLAGRFTGLIERIRDEKASELRDALRGIVTPALLGLINEGDDEPKAMPDDAAVDVSGNGFRCQITVGDIRKAAAALDYR